MANVDAPTIPKVSTRPRRREEKKRPRHLYIAEALRRSGLETKRHFSTSQCFRSMTTY